MHIVHLISGGDAGGAKTHVLTLLQGLCKTEQVRLVCFVEGDFTREARELGIPVTVIPTGNLFRVLRQLRQLLRQERADVLHCHGARANFMAFFLRKKLGIPVVTTVHSDYRLDYLGRPLGRLTYGTINTFALRFIPWFVGVSDAMKEMLVSRGFPASRIFPLYNGVIFPAPVPAMDRRQYLASLGLSHWEDCVIVGIAARLSAVKDVATLIRGFALACETDANIRLLIAGDGEQRQELEKLAAELCPPGRCFFCGWVTDITSFYETLDINTLTSLSETFPYALTEGARMGCATISTRVGGVPRLIHHGETGLLFTPGDREALAGHLCALAGDAALRRRLGEALLEKTRREFSVDAMVRRQKEIYEEILQRDARCRQNDRDGVLICGAYGRDNAGDDAILEAIVSQLRQLDRYIPLYVLSRKPRQTALRYSTEGIYTFSFLKFCRCLRHTRLYLHGGGSLIQDVTSSRSLWYYLLSLATAKKSGNRVIMYGCGIGPVTGKQNRRLAGRIIDRSADVITLRENFSYKELKAMGVSAPEMQVTADPAILLTPAEGDRVSAFLREAGLGAEEKFFLIALRPWQRQTQYQPVAAACAARICRERGLRPVFLAMEPKTDLACCRAAAELADCGAVTLAAPADSRLLIGVMERAELVIAMRLHALIFAAGVGTPLVGVSYDPKVEGFLRYMGLDGCLSLEDLTEQKLLAAAEQAMTGTFDFAAQALRLRSLAEENRAAAARLLEL